MGVKRRSRQEWSELAEKWEQSGLSRRVFAKKHGLKCSTFSWWTSELKSEAIRDAEPVFVPVEVRAEALRDETSPHPVVVLEHGTARRDCESASKPTRAGWPPCCSS
jgi:hypothetical protein